MKLALLILIALAADAGADDMFVLQHDRGRRLDFLETKRCGDDFYAYLIKNTRAIEAIEIAVEDELKLALKFQNVPERRRLTRSLGLRGFLDVSTHQSFYVALDPDARTVTIALMRRTGATICAERWVAPIVRGST